MSSSERARVCTKIDAAPNAVFDAWIQPEVMERWLFKSPTNTLSASTSPSPGGTYSIVEHSEGRMNPHDGTYSVVDRPLRLEFNLRAPQHFEGVAQIELTIVPEQSGSRLTLVQRHAGPEDAQGSWERMLGNLAALLAEPTLG